MNNSFFRNILDIFKIKEFKQEITNLKRENEELMKIKYDADQMQYLDLKKEIRDLTISKENSLKEIDSLNQKKIDIENEMNNKIRQLEGELEFMKQQIVVLEEQELMQSFGFYNPRYNLEDSESYKLKLDEIRKKQKDMVKNKTAVNYFDGWTLDGSKKEGKKMNDDNIKLFLRSFNNECDASILKVKFNNIDSIKKRIEKAFDVLNKLGERTKISIKRHYLDLKLEELYLAYEYEIKKQEEREEQQRIKEQMREEQRALKEIEKAKEKLEKEEKHFTQAIEQLTDKMNTASPEEKKEYELKINELKDKLAELEKDKQDIINREQNTRAGYVYVISNIGSFGENVYKIGMTRRLEPLDRVKELGDASVPFSFDVHAMIFSEDAPKLENALHKTFEKYSVNKINLRKEFFNVTLSEIEQVVKNNHNKVVEFTKLAEASEYRQSLQLKKINQEKVS